MSDDQEGLPTAANEYECENTDCSHKYYSSNSSQSIEGTYCGKHRGFSEGGVFEKQNELVRRADVEGLIQDRLEKQEKRVENLTGLDRVNLNDAKARREELKSLLDEVLRE